MPEGGALRTPLFLFFPCALRFLRFNSVSMLKKGSQKSQMFQESRMLQVSESLVRGAANQKLCSYRWVELSRTLCYPVSLFIIKFSSKFVSCTVPKQVFRHNARRFKLKIVRGE